MERLEEQLEFEFMEYIRKEETKEERAARPFALMGLGIAIGGLTSAVYTGQFSMLVDAFRNYLKI